MKILGNWCGITAMLGCIWLVPFSASAQTWQASGKTATLPIVTENTACNPTKETAGVNATRTGFLMCQSNLWKQVSTGGTGGGGSCGAPAPFAFVPHLELMQVGTLQTSNQIKLSGTSCPSALTVSGGNNPQCSINSAVFGVCGGYLAPGDTLIVRQNASVSNGEQTNLTVTIAGVSAIFAVSTHAFFWSVWYENIMCYAPDQVYYQLGTTGDSYTPGTDCNYAWNNNRTIRAWYSVRTPAYDSYCVAADPDGNGTSAAIVLNVQACQ